MADFIHLHNHSEFSLLDGLSKVKAMAKRAKELNMKALAITDHGSLYGAIYFYKACLEAGIKPIIGCEIYITKGKRQDKEAGYNHLILLAENNIGYKNLMRIVSRANLEGYYYKPRTDVALLQEHHEGIICLSACVNGYISEPLLAGQEQEAERRAQELAAIFGPDHFYIELQKHLNVPPQEVVNPKLLALANKLGLPVVATNDNHYTSKGDAEAQEILLCIQTQTTITQTDRKMSMISSPDFYLKSSDEMTGLFIQTPEAISNTSKIADMCNVEITLGKWIMPRFEVPGGKSHEAYLEELVAIGAKDRYGEITEDIKKRIDYEMSVICNKGYATYFLTVQDFVNWAKNNGVSVGPGRGSAAGSVISYCLQITDIDPFFFKLPFERFLNPLRPSAPDIDLDFADTRRDQVIAYVTQKYGADKVAQIITFGTMEAKGSIRDTGRALGMPYAGPDRISKMIPPGWQGHAMTLDNALQQSPDLKRAYDSEPETKRLLDIARKIEGVVRHASVHAAGVVIADKPLTEYVPIQREPNGGDKIVTQYDMYTVGEDGVGLLKMDFLGLRNLTIIEEALKFIKQNQDISINISTLPIDDAPTYELLASAETTGIFQLESPGMRRYIKELKPTTIFDLMAMVALYRPGPMQNIPEFIARKQNPLLIKYPDPRLIDALSESYGMLVYQDDVLLTTIELAGYTWLDADKFRKAMGKKIPAEMKKQQELFLSGAVKRGLTQKKAEEIFQLIAPFAGYGFNKAHAACYATIAYRTAYLKAHYPVEFMTALLTAESRGTGPARDEKIAQAVAECRRLQVTLLPPHINKSEQEFQIENKTKVRFGLSAIKNVGTAAIAAIIAARENGPFISFEDFCVRVDGSAVTKKTMECLIKAGAMDEFGKRAVLLASFMETTEKASRIKKQQQEGQGSLFGDEPETKTIIRANVFDGLEDFSDAEKLAFEKELLGIYLTSHPQAQYIDYLRSVTTHELDVLPEQNDGTQVTVGGFIDSVKKIFTKKTGAEMAFISLSNEKGIAIECVIFPKIFDLYKMVLAKDGVVVIEGKIDIKNEKPVIIVNSVRKPKIAA